MSRCLVIGSAFYGGIMMSYTWLSMLLMETWQRFWLVTCYGESSGRLTGSVYDSDPNVMNLWDDGCLWHGWDGWMDRISVRTVRCRLNVTLYLPVWRSFYLFTIFFTSFLIKRLEIDYMPSCTHFYPSRMDWTDGTVPYDGFSFSYDGVSFFCVFFFYFSYITLHYTYLCHIYSKLDIICGLLYITHAML
mgnify:CR=1 FL=1